MTTYSYRRWLDRLCDKDKIHTQIGFHTFVVKGDAPARTSFAVAPFISVYTHFSFFFLHLSSCCSAYLMLMPNSIKILVILYITRPTRVEPFRLIVSTVGYVFIQRILQRFTCFIVKYLQINILIWFLYLTNLAY